MTSIKWVFEQSPEMGGASGVSGVEFDVRRFD